MLMSMSLRSVVGGLYRAPPEPPGEGNGEGQREGGGGRVPLGQHPGAARQGEGREKGDCGGGDGGRGQIIDDTQKRTKTESVSAPV